MPAPRVIVFGYDELALASVDMVRRLEGEVVAAVFPSNKTDPRMDQVRRQIEDLGIQTLRQPPRRRIGTLAGQLRRRNPDLLLVWSYPMILPPALLEVPRRGAFNLHMGLLPEYRGANGIVRALINGEPQTGVTLHVMDAGIDTGAMVAQARFQIAPEDDIIALLQRAHLAGRSVLEKSWTSLVSGTAVLMPQDESRAGYCPPLTDEESRIDWGQPSVRIHNLVRALVSGAAARFDDQEVLILRSELLAGIESAAAAGEIIESRADGLCVQTGDGVLLVKEVEVAGRRHDRGFDQLGMSPGKRFASG